MSDQDSPGERAQASSEIWAVICDEYPDLQRWANRTEQHQLFSELRERAGRDDALPDWLALREEMRRRVRDEREVVKTSLQDAYEKILIGAPQRPDAEVYICPAEQKCARRAQADGPGEPPVCDLFDILMDLA